LVYTANGYGMLRLFLRLLRNEDGYTAVECGILSCLVVIFAEKLALNI
jgi:NADH:ubiquinone oxidoreductase subunit 4 (subunit M)